MMSEKAAAPYGNLCLASLRAFAPRIVIGSGTGPKGGCPAPIHRLAVDVLPRLRPHVRLGEVVPQLGHSFSFPATVSDQLAACGEQPSGNRDRAVCLNERIQHRPHFTGDG